ncbi:MAG: helix-turn-helix transcriptional regulator [Eubacteriales bacterium]|nr:helix-turn-helix transcriptional regulator [Eubacteriales bacterium]
MRIRKQRKLMQMTQDQLSEKAGISLSFLGHIERGSRKSSLETLVSLANALEVSADYLLQDSLKIVDSVAQSQYSSSVQSLLRELTSALREE